MLWGCVSARPAKHPKPLQTFDPCRQITEQLGMFASVIVVVPRHPIHAANRYRTACMQVCL